MTESHLTPDGMTLVAIDIDKDGHDVLIEPASGSRRQRFRMANTIADYVVGGRTYHHGPSRPLSERGADHPINFQGVQDTCLSSRPGLGYTGIAGSTPRTSRASHDRQRYCWIDDCARHFGVEILDQVHGIFDVGGPNGDCLALRIG